MKNDLKTSPHKNHIFQKSNPPQSIPFANPNSKLPLRPLNFSFGLNQLDQKPSKAHTKTKIDQLIAY